MKRLFTFVLLVSATVPNIAAAASFIVTPQSGTYDAGDLVTLAISVNPESSSVYTSMLDARFSPSVFEVVSFAMNDSMLPMRQSGYDTINNEAGILTKTGGYAGGATAITSFGTLVLRAKATGTGTFTITDNSKLYDASNADQQAGSSSYSYIIAPNAPPAVMGEQTIAQRTVSQEQSSQQQASTQTPQPTSSEATSTNTAGEASTQFAAAAEAGLDTDVSLPWLAAITGIILAFIGGYFVGRRRLWR